MFRSVRYTGGSGGMESACQQNGADYSDGEVNFGPLIDLNTEDFCSTVKDTTMAKSPVPVGSSTPHSTGFCGIFHCVRNISALAGSTNTQDCI